MDIRWTERLTAWLGLAFLSMNAGLGKSDPWAAIPGARAMWGIAWAFSFACLFTPLGERIGRGVSAALDRSIVRSSIIAWIGTLALLSWKKFAFAGYRFPWPHLALCAAALPFVRTRWMPYGLNIALLVASIAMFPLDHHRSDMLTAISLSLDNWRAGKPIYVYHALEWGSIPTYFPLIFVSHLPAWALGWDLRWNTVLYRIVWMIALSRSLRRNGRDRDPRVAGLIFLTLLNPYWCFRHELYFEAYLLLVVLAWTSPLGDAALGLAAWTRNFVVLYWPFLALRRLRERDFRSLLAFAAALVAAGALVYAFFLPEDWTGWWHAKDYFLTLLEKPSFQGDFGLTVAPALFALGWQHASFALQFGGGAILGSVALANRRIPELVLAVAGITWFLGLNVMFWNYFLISQCLWLVVGLCSHPEAFNPARRQTAR